MLVAPPNVDLFRSVLGLDGGAEDEADDEAVDGEDDFASGWLLDDGRAELRLVLGFIKSLFDFRVALSLLLEFARRCGVWEMSEGISGCGSTGSDVDVVDDTDDGGGGSGGDCDKDPALRLESADMTFSFAMDSASLLAISASRFFRFRSLSSPALLFPMLSLHIPVSMSVLQLEFSDFSESSIVAKRRVSVCFECNDCRVCKCLICTAFNILEEVRAPSWERKPGDVCDVWDI